MKYTDKILHFLVWIFFTYLFLGIFNKITTFFICLFLGYWKEKIDEKIGSKFSIGDIIADILGTITILLLVK